ncbi:hypothetical protein B0H10DRAFT_1948928 [Mycena sp. CBHHK59/15]|nr:hypothetical protein B0H10DRAFT_1956011 [Mycena sp. CBHHK59/15]KAJ6616771.1 hypothetical protein B0H10DRAFT_1948928 [Mycena sp. CBHHK59/15]
MAPLSYLEELLIQNRHGYMWLLGCEKTGIDFAATRDREINGAGAYSFKSTNPSHVVGCTHVRGRLLQYTPSLVGEVRMVEDIGIDPALGLLVTVRLPCRADSATSEFFMKQVETLQDVVQTERTTKPCHAVQSDWLSDSPEDSNVADIKVWVPTNGVALQEGADFRFLVRMQMRCVLDGEHTTKPHLLSPSMSTFISNLFANGPLGGYKVLATGIYKRDFDATRDRSIGANPPVHLYSFKDMTLSPSTGVTHRRPCLPVYAAQMIGQVDRIIYTIDEQDDAQASVVRIKCPDICTDAVAKLYMAQTNALDRIIEDDMRDIVWIKHPDIHTDSSPWGFIQEGMDVQVTATLKRLQLDIDNKGERNKLRELYPHKNDCGRPRILATDKYNVDYAGTRDRTIENTTGTFARFSFKDAHDADVPNNDEAWDGRWVLSKYRTWVIGQVDSIDEGHNENPINNQDKGTACYLLRLKCPERANEETRSFFHKQLEGLKSVIESDMHDMPGSVAVSWLGPADPDGVETILLVVPFEMEPWYIQAGCDLQVTACFTRDERAVGEDKTEKDTPLVTGLGSSVLLDEDFGHVRREIMVPPQLACSPNDGPQSTKKGTQLVEDREIRTMAGETLHRFSCKKMHINPTPESSHRAQIFRTILPVYETWVVGQVHSVMPIYDYQPLEAQIDPKRAGFIITIKCPDTADSKSRRFLLQQVRTLEDIVRQDTEECLPKSAKIYGWFGPSVNGMKTLEVRYTFESIRLSESGSGYNLWDDFVAWNGFGTPWVFLPQQHMKLQIHLTRDDTSHSKRYTAWIRAFMLLDDDDL